MWKHLIAASCVVPLLMGQAPMELPDCNLRYDSVDKSDPGAPVIGYVGRIKAGRSCQIRYDLAGGDVRAGRVMIEDVVVTVKPTFGSLERSGRRITYKAPSGYSGADVFAFSLKMQRGNERGYRNIAVAFAIN